MICNFVSPRSETIDLLTSCHVRAFIRTSPVQGIMFSIVIRNYLSCGSISHGEAVKPVCADFAFTWLAETASWV